MNDTPKEIETTEERLRRWKKEHVCWVTKDVIRSGVLRCSCGFTQTVEGREAAYSAQAEHLKATMPNLELPGPRVGHWLFLRSPSKGKKEETWICRCILCGFEASRVDYFGTLHPLTGKLSQARRKHDKEMHSGKFAEQRNEEAALLARTSSQEIYDADLEDTTSPPHVGRRVKTRRCRTCLHEAEFHDGNAGVCTAKVYHAQGFGRGSVIEQCGCPMYEPELELAKAIENQLLEEQGFQSSGRPRRLGKRLSWLHRQNAERLPEDAYAYELEERLAVEQQIPEMLQGRRGRLSDVGPASGQAECRAVKPVRGDVAPSKTAPYTPKIGDHVQWISQGANQFSEPKRIRGISPDGQYAFVEGSNTGIPVAQLEQRSAPAPEPATPRPEGATPEQLRALRSQSPYREIDARDEGIAESEEGGAKYRFGSLRFKIGERGGVSVYNLGRFPVTLYYEQWVRLLDAADGLLAFLEENKSKLKLRDKPNRT